MMRLGAPADKQEPRLNTDTAEGERAQNAVDNVILHRQVVSA